MEHGHIIEEAVQHQLFPTGSCYFLIPHMSFGAQSEDMYAVRCDFVQNTISVCGFTATVGRGNSQPSLQTCPCSHLATFSEEAVTLK